MNTNKHKAEMGGYRPSIFADLFRYDEKAPEHSLELFNGLNGNVKLLDPNDIDTMMVDPDIIRISAKEGRLMDLYVGNIRKKFQPNIFDEMLLYCNRRALGEDPVEPLYQKKMYIVHSCEVPDGIPVKQSISIIKQDLITGEEERTDISYDIPLIHLISSNHKIWNCKILLEYAQFCELANQIKERNSETWQEETVKRCLELNILSEYLGRKGDIVPRMLREKAEEEREIARWFAKRLGLKVE